MALIEVMRRKDAPHIYFAANPELRARIDTLELAWLDTDTKKTYAHDDKPAPKPSVAKPAPRASKSAPKAAAKPRGRKKLDLGASAFDDESLLVGLD